MDLKETLVHRDLSDQLASLALLGWLDYQGELDLLVFLVIKACLGHQVVRALKEHLGLQDPPDPMVIRVYRAFRVLLGQLDYKDHRVHPDLGEIQASREAKDHQDHRVNRVDKDLKAILVQMGTSELRDP